MTLKAICKAMLMTLVQTTQLVNGTYTQFRSLYDLSFSSPKGSKIATIELSKKLCNSRRYSIASENYSTPYQKETLSSDLGVVGLSHRRRALK